MTSALCVSEHTWGGIPVGHVDACDCVCAHVLADDRELSAVRRQGFEHRSRDKLKPESVSETHPVRTCQLTAGQRDSDAQWFLVYSCFPETSFVAPENS